MLLSYKTLTSWTCFHPPQFSAALCASAVKKTSGGAREPRRFRLSTFDLSQSINRKGISSVRKLAGSFHPIGSQVAARSGARKVIRISSVGRYLRISSR